jgi:hypothetical protein
MFSTLYDFCRDQGSIIGGLLALAAGYLVFRGTTRTADRQVAAANAQTEALRQKNRDLRNEGQRRQARDGIVATKLLASVLGVITNDVDKLTGLLDQPRYAGTNRLVPTNYRQLLFKPPLNIVWDDLGMCSPDIVKGARDAQYGHELNLVAGHSGLILDVVVEAGNPADAKSVCLG